MLRRIREYIEAQDLLPPGARVVVGLSGGVDSVVLAHVLARLDFEPLAAHVNFGLRGEASAQDEALVQRWCAAQAPPVALHVVRRHPAARAAKRGQSIQEAARDQRYAFFAVLAKQEQVRHVAVAHHRDDQAETLLLNLFRGSGVEGLAGMAAARPLGEALTLVRPLLPATRAEIRAYAEEHDLEWRVDATNKHPKYRRGALRAAVLPVIKEHFGAGVVENIARAADLVRDYVEATVQPDLEARFAACAQPAPGGGSLRLRLLEEQSAVWRTRLILEALQRWLPGAPRRSAAAEEIEALLRAQVGRRVEFGGHTVWRERAHLRFVRAADVNGTVVPVPLGQPVQLPGGTLCVEALGAPPETLHVPGGRAEHADLDALAFPLTARPWAPGDRFQPLGMAHTKAVSDFLTDEKVPPHRRAGVHVLLSGDTIVWVVGHRLAEGARVTDATRQVGRLRFAPGAASPNDS